MADKKLNTDQEENPQYCCDACGAEANRKMQRERNAVNRTKEIA